MWRRDNKRDASSKDPYAERRRYLVENHVAARGVRDPRLLDTMLAVPRHRFIPQSAWDSAYEDRPIEIGFHQTISQPYMVALMTELCGLRPSDRVLEIGTGSGYQTAILASLAAHVSSIERIEELARRAERVLSELGYSNVRIQLGDGTLGDPDHAPFDVILVTAGAPAVPRALKSQLEPSGGRLICPVGPRALQKLVKIVRQEDTFTETESIGCIFVPLIGTEGWNE